MDRTDEELIADYRAGDEDAFERLIDRHLASIHSFLARTTGAGEDTADLAQEVFLKAWKKLGQFDTKRRFRSWLFAIARNVAIDWHRARKSVPFSSLDAEDLPFEDTLLDPEPLPDELFAKAELGRLLEDALALLPPASRTLVLLHHQGGLTFEEIAKAEGRSVNTIKSLYRRALLKVREALSGRLHP